MAELYFYKYNNAYNKIVRKKDTFADYQQYQIGSALQNINFNPNDGITAEHIINWNNDIPDYMIVGDGGEIVSRWFVMEAQRTRGGQLRISLLRDVLADNYDAVLNSKCFVQKGYVPDSSPLIFNNENMGFNQIKRGETLLKNNLETPWLVLYLARYNNNGEYNSFTGSFNEEVTSAPADYELDSLSEYKYYNWSDQIPISTWESRLEYVPQNSFLFELPYIRLAGTTVSSSHQAIISRNGISNSTIGTGNLNINYPYLRSGFQLSINGLPGTYDNLANILYGATEIVDNAEVLSYMPAQGTSRICTQNTYNDVLNENGKIIQVGDKRYRIGVRTSSWDSGQVTSINKDSELGIAMKNTYQYINNMVYTDRLDNVDNFLSVSCSEHISISLTISEIGGVEKTSYSYNITYNGAETSDAPYEILATPYYNISFVDGSETINHRGDIANQWFQEIINKFNTSNFAYDLQLVPYCPVDVTNITTFEKTYLTYSGGTKTAVAFKISQASFTAQYQLNLTFDSNYKISNETEKFRFVSPNGVGDYEFSPAKNGGVSYFEVDCTLIPFHPYIKVNPVFSNLYGQDFNDYRGLICGGDFSLPILNNSWETYQLNNKYYQDIFNRKIETQEYNNKWQLASNIAGAVSGAAGGAAMGGMIGSPIGAIAGGLLSAAGGITDVIAGQAMFREGIDYQKDMFGYELGTIKAHAESLTRTTAYNINNKYFPYVEYYSCTDKERQALQDKIKYNGMTVGVIGTLSEYLNPTETSFFQGQLIEIDITDDAHTAHEIARELQEGRRFEH